MSEWHRTNSLSKGKMICNDGLKNKRSANSLHFSWEFRAVFNQRKSSCKRTRCLTKISPKKITSKKQKILKCVAFRTGGGPAQFKSNCKEHAGSDKRFNTTLFLD